METHFAEIERQISLWDQRGSEALFGTLLVIPIEESLIYVRPLYLRSEGGKIPELKRVIVAYEKQIVMEPSLKEAMDAIFAQEPSPKLEVAVAEPADAADAGSTTTAPPPPPIVKLTPGGTPQVRALQHFERAVQAQREGRWADYGQELERVEGLLRQMQPAATPAAKPAAEPQPAAAP